MIKNNRSQHALALAATLTAFCTIDLAENNTHAASADSPKTIFIIMDGIPTDVVESVPTPNLDDISSKGGFAPSFVGGEIGGPSESPTVSAVGYQSLLTGTWANKHNVWDNDVDEPNYAYWDIFRIAKAHDSTLSTAVFSTWTDNRTKLIGNGLTWLHRQRSRKRRGSIRSQERAGPRLGLFGIHGWCCTCIRRQ
jgi:hypothetical protein